MTSDHTDGLNDRHNGGSVTESAGTLNTAVGSGPIGL